MVTATISKVYQIEPETGGRWVQKLILDNVISVNTVENVESRVVCIVKLASIDDEIPFKTGHPITVKGSYKRPTTDFLATINNCHRPLGFIRYDGKVYR